MTKAKTPKNNVITYVIEGTINLDNWNTKDAIDSITALVESARESGEAFCSATIPHTEINL